MQVWDVQYEFDGERKTLNDLIMFHRQYVDDDYPFEEWFRGHIQCGVIKPLTSDHDSDMEKRTVADEGRNYFKKLYNPASLRNREEYVKCLARYETICQLYDPIRTEPLIKNKLASYFRGEYHLLGKEWILAEGAYLKALVVWAPKETNCIITDGKIKFRLLQIYYAQERFEYVIPLIEELLAAIRNGRSDYGLSEDDIYCIYMMKCYVSERSLGHNDLAALKNMLAKIHRDILGCGSHEILELSDKCLAFAFVSIILLAGNHHISPKECGSYREILDYVNANKDVLLAGDAQKMLMLDAYELIM